MKNKEKKIDTSFQIPVTLKAEDVISLAIEKTSPKKVINIILGQCLWNTLEKCRFPSNFFATKEDEEKADATAALYYLKKNWKECSDKGMKMLVELVKKNKTPTE
jgi:hypothetical protein